MELAQLLAFIRQPAARAADINLPGIPSNQIRKARQAAEEAERQKAERAQSLAGMADQLYGNPAVQGSPEQFIQNPNEMQGQGALSNLANEIIPEQQGSPATGLFDASVPMEQRLMEMNKRMLSSGDPGLQAQWAKNNNQMQEGILDKIKAMDTKQLGIDNPTMGAYAKNALAMGLKPGSPEFIEAVKNQTEKNLFEKSGNKVYSVGEQKGMMMPDGGRVPRDLTPNKAIELGIQNRNELSGDNAGKFVMLDTALKNIPVIDGILLDKDGMVKPQRAGDVSKYNAMAKIPFVGEYISTAFSDKDTQKLANAFEYGIQAITRTETGAAMAASELDNTRKRFMPIYGEDGEVTLQKLNAYKYFLRNAVKKIDSTANASGLPPSTVVNALVEESFRKAGEIAPKTIKQEVSDEIDYSKPFEDPAEEAEYQAWRKLNP